MKKQVAIINKNATTSQGIIYTWQRNYLTIKFYEFYAKMPKTYAFYTPIPIL